MGQGKKTTVLTYSFHNTSSSFFWVLKKRVNYYFSENKIQPVGNYKLWTKAMVLLLTAGALHGGLLFLELPTWLALILCAVLGLNLALIGFNIMHDGGHKTFSPYSWLNAVAAHMLNVLGGTAYYWKVKHNINHHTYTNVERYGLRH